MNKYKNTGMSLAQFVRNQVSGGRRVIVTAGSGACGCNLDIEVIDPDLERIERSAHEAGDAAPYPYGVVVRGRMLIGSTVEILDNAAPDFDV